MDTSDLTCTFEITKSSDDDGSFTGIASTADLDVQNDIIEPGAFDPIAVNRRTGGPDVLMLRDHDIKSIIGGWTSFKQQSNRLLVEGQLCLEVEKARETYALMKRGFLTGLSIGFSANKDDIIYSRNGKRHVRKGILKECSIVAAPANQNARILNVKDCGCQDDELVNIKQWLAARGLTEDDITLLGRKEDAPVKPYGDVAYADPGYQEDKKKRYPIDTEGHIRAAWNYFSKPKNRALYSKDQVSAIEGRIVAAWKRVIDKDGPPAAQKTESWFNVVDVKDPGEIVKALRDLQLKARGLSYG